MSLKPPPVPITILKEGQHAIWSFDMKQRIGANQEALEVMTGEYKAPSSPDDKASTEVIAQHKANLRKWKELDSLVKSHLLVAVNPAVKQILQGFDTSNEMWSYLKRSYGTILYSHKLTLEEAFSALKQGENQAPEAFFEVILSKQQELAELGHSIDIRRVIRVTIWGLHPRYNSLTDNFVSFLDEWTSAENAKIDHALVLKLMGRIKSSINASKTLAPVGKSEPTKQEPSAMVANNKGTGKSKNKGKGKSKGTANANANDPTCTHCNRTGHTKDGCYFNPDCKAYRPDWAARSSANKPAPQGSGRDMAAIAIAQVNDYAFTVDGTKKWLTDSGATKHYTFAKSDFTDLVEGDFGAIKVGGKRLLPIKGHGTVVLHVIVDGIVARRFLHDTKWVPDLGYRLYSIEEGLDLGYRLEHETTHQRMYTAAGETVFDTDKVDRCRYIRLATATDASANEGTNEVSQTPAQAAVTTLPVPAKCSLWHQRLGHIAVKAVKLTMASHKLPVHEHKEGKICQPCLQGGQARRSFKPSSTPKATSPLGLVVTDVMGPLPPSQGGSRFVVTFKDNCTGYVVVYCTKLKSEVPSRFRTYLPQVERHTGKQLKVLRSDGGGEYCNADLLGYLESLGIAHEITIARTPMQNGDAERLGRTLFNMVRAMLAVSGGASRLWAEAVLHATWILNRTVQVGQDTSPYAKWNGQPAKDLSDLRTFGCAAHAADTTYLKKLDSRSKPLIFIGFVEHRKGWKLFDPATGKTSISADVIFDETSYPLAQSTSAEDNEVLRQLDESLDAIEQEEQEQRQPIRGSPDAESDSEQEEQEPMGEPEQPPEAPELPDENNEAEPDDEEPLGRGMREKRPNPRYVDGARVATLDDYEELEHKSLVAQAMVSAEEALSEEPSTVKQAQARPDWPDWLLAIETELANHDANNTWEVTTLPPGRKAIGSRWVFKVKRGPDGKVLKYKARLVAQGFTQREGIDFAETYSPVVRQESIRVAINIATQHQWQIHHLDVVAAYLNGVLEEEIFMAQPPEFGDGTQRVLRLRKGLYGLRQSGRVWYYRAHIEFLKLGLICLDADQGLYFMVTKSGDMVIICIYVDDLVVTASTIALLTFMKAQLTAIFKMTDDGEIGYILGIKVEHSPTQVKLHQSAYVDKLVNRFGLTNTRPAFTPIMAGFDAEIADESPELSQAKKQLYQQLIGALMYAALGTRPDISFALQLLSRSLASPTIMHLTAAQHVLRYLKTTSTYGIVYLKGKQGDGDELLVYCDADYAGDRATGKSTSGIITLLNDGIITWSTRKQDCIALSTLESEYVAICEAAKETAWLRELLNELHHAQADPTIIYSDNTGAISYSGNSTSHRRTKHINVRYHFIRKMIADKQAIVKYIPTTEQLADILTKALARVKHEAAIKLLRLSQT